MFKTSFVGNNMLMDIAYAQPSPLTSRPAFLNLNSGIVTSEINMFQVKTNLQELFPNAAVNFASQYRVDVANELVTGAFSINDINGMNYAVFFADYEANILNHVAVDIEPYAILIR